MNYIGEAKIFSKPFAPVGRFWPGLGVQDVRLEGFAAVEWRRCALCL